MAVTNASTEREKQESFARSACILGIRQHIDMRPQDSRQEHFGMSTLHRYDGRRVLITGGGSGIGQATTLRILAEGGRVVAADISESGLSDTVAKAGAGSERLSTVRMDIAAEASVRAGVAEPSGGSVASTP
jgi:FlaA1/EpsC-like NDP-sugar epimerase